MPQSVYIIGALIVIIAVLAAMAMRRARKQGAAEATADLAHRQATEAEKKAEAGRVAVTEAKTDLRKGKTPAQIKAENNAKWGRK